MDNTVSISKGCFAFKRAKERSKSKVTQPPHIEYFHKLWRKVEKKLTKHVIDNDKLNSFLREADDCIRMSTMPIGVLSSEFSINDQVDNVNEIKNILESTEKTVSAVLNSSDFTDLSTALDCISRQFMNSEPSKKKLIFKDLCHWYNELRENNPEDVPKLIVFLPDLELIEPKLFNDLVIIMHSYVELPFILIVGVAVKVTLLNELLSPTAKSKVLVHSIYTENTTERFIELIENVILNPTFSVRLSGDVLHCLMTKFLNYNLSIKSFVNDLKLCFLNHCLMGDLITLCDQFLHGEYLDYQIRDFMESKYSTKLLASIKDPEVILSIQANHDHLNLSKLIYHDLACAEIYWYNYFGFLRMFYCFIADVPSQPFGKTLSEFYCNLMKSKLSENTEMEKVWQVLELISTDDLVKKIEDIISVSKEYYNKYSILMVPGDSHTIEVFKRLNKELKVQLNELSVDIQSDEQMVNDESQPNQPLGKLSRQALKDQIRSMSKMQNSKDTGSAKKSGVLSYLKLCFEENLQPPHKIEGICLMDLSLISDVNFVKNQMGNVRASVEGSLTNPYIDLMCKCCRDSTRILKTMPDVAIAFKLLLEAGETMNIYDWLQAFNNILHPDDESGDLSEEVQARFAVVLKELQFYGFVAPARKKNHITRLIW